MYISSFKRPVSIGVYGHPSHEISKYTLLVFDVMVEDDIPYDQTSRNTYKDRDNKVSNHSLFLFFIFHMDIYFFDLFNTDILL